LYMDLGREQIAYVRGKRGKDRIVRGDQAGPRLYTRPPGRGQPRSRPR
jgi:hypothetical protein